MTNVATKIRKEAQYEVRYQAAAIALASICEDNGYDLALLRHRLNDNNRSMVKKVATHLLASGYPGELVCDIIHKSKKSVKDLVDG